MVQFKYLGVLFTSGGRIVRKVNRRIGAGGMDDVWKSEITPSIMTHSLIKVKSFYCHVTFQACLP